MKKTIQCLLLAIIAVVMFDSCSSTATYAEQREAELEAISSYLVKKNIQVISETDFYAQDSTTDVSKNQYVLFQKSGVYMQIVSKGSGKKLESGESADVLCRFIEYNINGDSTSLTDLHVNYPEKLNVRNNSGTFVANFEYSWLNYCYSLNGSVPSGWLVPLRYINLGRLLTETDKYAEVNIIVPHDQGHTVATSNVVAYAYHLTYERGR